MLIRQSFDTFIRIWGDTGYIVNKANYSDRVVNKSGSMFLKALSRQPQEFDDICKKILKDFKNVDLETIKKDAHEFYKALSDDGFILIGETKEELDKCEKRFSYKDITPRTITKDFTPITKRSDEISQTKLDEKFKDKPQLVNFQIELTSKCNERCIHCYIPHENKINDIEDELYYSVLEQLRDMGVLTLTLSGGEPMTHPKFIDYLKKAKEYDFAINILSNLTLLDDKIIKEIKSLRLTSIQVSLYSMNPEIHDKITCLKGSIEKTKNAILKCVENDIPLQISAPCMRENKDTLMDVFD